MVQLVISAAGCQALLGGQGAGQEGPAGRTLPQQLSAASCPGRLVEVGAGQEDPPWTALQDPPNISDQSEQSVRSAFLTPFLKPFDFSV